MTDAVTNISRAIADQYLEDGIVGIRKAMVIEADKPRQKQLAAVLAKLIKMRSPEQVAMMEREAGLL